MPVSATRHFEASYSTIEWLLDEYDGELDEAEREALVRTHEILRRTSNEIWGSTPPALPHKVGDVTVPDGLEAEDYE